jgi:crossover junction endodeoxyribonuclease RuvC
VPIVLGLDPGTRHFGWGVVEQRGTRLFHIAHGTVHTDVHAAIALRLVAAKLGHARGVALLVCARAGVPVHEYAPALVKRSVVGSGRAEKSQVAQMVRVVLRLDGPPPADAADALALALTHLQRVRPTRP